ncbi:hypothetical protein L1987_81619 [Smallanthus sonchifolius]|uniref:Uncharacterized protein n=1 Tax=Smallanthus sonchifolius TaxID=185202 RepID=A0ACB8YRP8_9ASTR|nr:hypothetical protein L1987_81619 [Smallanthus sonchifolius]
MLNPTPSSLHRHCPTVIHRPYTFNTPLSSLTLTFSRHGAEELHHYSLHHLHSPRYAALFTGRLKLETAKSNEGIYEIDYRARRLILTDLCQTDLAMATLKVTRCKIPRRMVNRKDHQLKMPERRRFMDEDPTMVTSRHRQEGCSNGCYCSGLAHSIQKRRKSKQNLLTCF